MKTKFAQDSFTGMPSWAKGAIGIAVVGAILYVGYKLYKGGKNVVEQQGSREETRAIAQELDKANENQATRQILTKTQASSIANNLFTAMNGLGTDGGAIYKNLIQLKNNADWLAVNNAYGIRTLSSGKGNIFSPDFTGTLTASLTEELGVNDLMYTPKLNQLFKARGIKATI